MPRRENDFQNGGSRAGLPSDQPGGISASLRAPGQACKNLDARTLDLRLAKGSAAADPAGLARAGSGDIEPLARGRSGPAVHWSRRSAAHGCYRFGLCDVRVFFYTVQPFIHQGPEKRFLFDR